MPIALKSAHRGIRSNEKESGPKAFLILKESITLSLLIALGLQSRAYGEPDYTGSYECRARTGTVLPRTRKEMTPSHPLIFSSANASFSILVRRPPFDLPTVCKDFARDFISDKRKKGSREPFISKRSFARNYEFYYNCLMGYEVTIPPNLFNAEVKTTLRALDAFGHFEAIPSSADDEPDRFQLHLNVLKTSGYDYFLWTQDGLDAHVAIEGICKHI